MNAWLKRAIWIKQIFNKWPQENAFSNEQDGIHKYSINGQKRTPGSNEQYGIHKYSINGHKRTPSQTSNMEYTNIH